MKKSIFSVLLISLFLSNVVVAQEVDYSKKAHLAFDEGVVLSCVNRLQNQEGRTNFNWKDSMVGAFVTVRLNNFFTLDILARTEVFYPFLHSFNGMKVAPKQTLLYAFDEFVGIPFRFDKFKYFALNVVPGGHFMYQLSDEYNLFYIGGGAIVGAELPISSKWTVLLDGTFTVDYPNLGSNKLVQPFNLSWQWQTSLGVRYSKKMTNKYSYLGKKSVRERKQPEVEKESAEVSIDAASASEVKEISTEATDASEIKEE